MEAILAPHGNPKPKSTAVPSYLIYEVLDGEPIYFRGYQDVLNHKKTKEDIMATGRLQTLIIATLQEHLWQNHNREGLKYISNEVGIHISTNINKYTATVLQKVDSLIFIPKNLKIDNKLSIGYKIPVLLEHPNREDIFTDFTSPQ